jgi:hypothetical protein
MSSETLPAVFITLLQDLLHGRHLREEADLHQDDRPHEGHRNPLRYIIRYSPDTIDNAKIGSVHLVIFFPKQENLQETQKNYDHCLEQIQTIFLTHAVSTNIESIWELKIPSNDHFESYMRRAFYKDFFIDAKIRWKVHLRSEISIDIERQQTDETSREEFQNMPWNQILPISIPNDTFPLLTDDVKKIMREFIWKAPQQSGRKRMHVFSEALENMLKTNNIEASAILNTSKSEHGCESIGFNMAFQTQKEENAYRDHMQYVKFIQDVLFCAPRDATQSSSHLWQFSSPYPYSGSVTDFQQCIVFPETGQKITAKTQLSLKKLMQDQKEILCAHTLFQIVEEDLPDAQVELEKLQKTEGWTEVKPAEAQQVAVIPPLQPIPEAWIQIFRDFATDGAQLAMDRDTTKLEMMCRAMLDTIAKEEHSWLQPFYKEDKAQSRVLGFTMHCSTKQQLNTHLLEYPSMMQAYIFDYAPMQRKSNKVRGRLRDIVVRKDLFVFTGSVDAKQLVLTFQIEADRKQQMGKMPDKPEAVQNPSQHEQQAGVLEAVEENEDKIPLEEMSVFENISKDIWNLMQEYAAGPWNGTKNDFIDKTSFFHRQMMNLLRKPQRGDIGNNITQNCAPYNDAGGESMVLGILIYYSLPRQTEVSQSTVWYEKVIQYDISKCRQFMKEHFGNLETLASYETTLSETVPYGLLLKFQTHAAMVVLSEQYSTSNRTNSRTLFLKIHIAPYSEESYTKKLRSNAAQFPWRSLFLREGNQQLPWLLNSENTQTTPPKEDDSDKDNIEPDPSPIDNDIIQYKQLPKLQKAVEQITDSKKLQTMCSFQSIPSNVWKVMQDYAVGKWRDPHTIHNDTTDCNQQMIKLLQNQDIRKIGYDITQTCSAYSNSGVIGLIIEYILPYRAGLLNTIVQQKVFEYDFQKYKDWIRNSFHTSEILECYSTNSKEDASYGYLLKFKKHAAIIMLSVPPSTEEKKIRKLTLKIHIAPYSDQTLMEQLRYLAAQFPWQSLSHSENREQLPWIVYSENSQTRPPKDDDSNKDNKQPENTTVIEHETIQTKEMSIYCASFPFMSFEFMKILQTICQCKPVETSYQNQIDMPKTLSFNISKMTWTIEEKCNASENSASLRVLYKCPLPKSKFVRHVISHDMHMMKNFIKLRLLRKTDVLIRNMWEITSNKHEYTLVAEFEDCLVTCVILHEKNATGRNLSFLVHQRPKDAIQHLLKNKNLVKIKLPHSYRDSKQPKPGMRMPRFFGRNKYRIGCECCGMPIQEDIFENSLNLFLQ